MSSQRTLSLVVSVINYRTGDLTLSCVQSVLDDLGGLSAQVVVVDNNSGDGSADRIERWVEKQTPPVPVSLLRSPTNSGFSGGHNQSLAAFRADYYLILNSDTVVRSGFFRTILAAAEANPAAGLFAPRIDHDDGVQQISCFRFPSPASELIRGAGSGPLTRLLSRYDVPLTMPPAPDQIGWASFACILLRGQMIAEIGPMDEGYFLYFEDVEYCWRARKAGWGICHVPDAKVVHLRGGSGPVKRLQRENERLPAYYYASRARFFRQAYGWGGLVAANALWVLGRGIAQTRRVLGKSVPSANRGEMRDLWINTGSPLASDHAARRDQA